MNDPFGEIMGPLGVLRGRIEEVAAQHGLKTVHVGILPSTDVEGPHEVQILMTLGEAQEPVDDGFEQVIAEARNAEMDERAKAAFDELENRLRGSKGFLDEPAGDE